MTMVVPQVKIFLVSKVCSVITESRDLHSMYVHPFNFNNLCQSDRFLKLFLRYRPLFQDHSLNRPVSISICQPVSLLICQPVSLSICQPISPVNPVSMSACQYDSLPMCQPVSHLSRCLCLSLQADVTFLCFRLKLISPSHQGNNSNSCKGAAGGDGAHAPPEFHTFG